MFRLLKLEDRIVLDGAGFADAMDESQQQDAYVAMTQIDDSGDFDTDVPLFADSLDADAAAGVRVLVISSDLKDGDDLAAAAKDDVIVVRYDAATTSLEDLAQLINDALAGQKADSIAFAAHNDGPYKLDLTDTVKMSAETLAADAAQQEFWAAVGSALNEDGRIDLLACNVVNDADGEAFVAHIESLSGVNVAASSDLTGNAAYGGNWVLESDGVDARAEYFDADALENFDTMMAGSPPYINDQANLDLLTRTATEGQYLFFNFKSTAFKDLDGETVKYWAEAEGQQIMSGYWLNFLAGTRTFYGTVPTGAGYLGQDIPVTIHAYDDGLYPTLDPTEITYTFIISIRAPYTAPTVSLTASPASVNEAAGPVTLTATLSAVTTAPVTVNLAYTDLGATDGADYSGPASITIPAGLLSATAKVTIINDTLVEPSEKFQVDIASVSSTTGVQEFGAQYQVITIIDDDTSALPPTVTLVPPAATAENAGPMILTATMDKTSTSPVTVNLSYTDVTTSGSADYIQTGTLIIPAGQTAGTAKITLVNDTVPEATETFKIAIASVINGTENGNQEVTATITDDDVIPPKVSLLTPAPVVEDNGTAVLTATMDRTAFDPVIVNLAYSATPTTPATFGTDYTGPTVLTIPAGQTSGTVTLQALPDTLAEGTEYFYIDIASVSSNALEDGVQQVKGTVTDNDVPVVNLSLTANSFSEAAGETFVKASLDRIAASNVTVNLAFSSAAGDALKDVDYVALATQITILKGATAASVKLIGSQDEIVEGDETFQVSIASVSANASVGASNIVTATVLDDETAPKVNLTIDSSSFSEKAGQSVVTVYTDKVSVSDVVVNVNAGGGTATLNTDYTAAPTVVTIPAGATKATLKLTGVDDTENEPDETFTVSLGTITGGVKGTLQTSLTATVLDDDGQPVVSLAPATVSFAENAGTAVITASLSAKTFEPVVINLNTVHGTTSSADFTLVPTVITIAPGATSGTFKLTGVDDANNEVDETFTVNLGGITGGTASLTANSVAGTVIDDDGQPVVTIEPATLSFTEASSAVATLKLSASSYQDVVVTLNVTDITAEKGTDYSVSATLITIAAGTTSATVKFSGIEDLDNEEDETFSVVIAGATNAGVGAAAAVTGTVVDNDGDPLVSLGIAPATVYESGGAATAVVTASLSAKTTVPVVVDIDFTGTADLNLDYTVNPVAQSITIPAGATSGTLKVAVLNDDSYELDETFTAAIKSASGAVIDTAADDVTGTIVSEDAPPLVSLALSPASMLENGGVAVVNINLSAESSQPVVVELDFTGGTATFDTDYKADFTAVTIAAGLPGTAIVLSGIDDLVTEGDETFVVKLGPITGGAEGTPNSVTGTITDNDKDPTVQLAFGTASFPETGAGSVLVNLSNASNKDVVVNLTYTGVAVEGPGQDYTAPATVTVPAGATQAKVDLTGIDDSLSEGDESFIVTLGTITNGTQGIVKTLTGTVIDDEGLPVVSFQTAPVSFAEDASANVQVQLSNASSQDVVVNLTYASGTAVQGTDFSTNAASVTITAGNTVTSFTLTGITDGVYEGDENFTVSLGSISNGTGTGSIVATVVDIDPAPQISLSPASVSFSEEAGTAVVTVSSDQISASDMVVTLGYTGTAAQGTDFSGATLVTIAAGSMTAQVTLTGIGDTVYETDETFTMSIGGVTGGTAVGSPVVGTVLDDDPMPVIGMSITPASFLESGSAKLQFTLDKAADVPVSFDLTFSPEGPGQAGEGTDYNAGAASVLFNPGQTLVSITLTAIDDTIYEGHETFTVSLDPASVVNGDMGTVTPSVTGTILENDAGPKLTLSPGTLTLNETAGSVVTVTASLDKTGALDVTFDLVLTPGTPGAEEGLDFTAGQTSVIIPMGQTQTSFQYTVVTDDIFEGDEVFNVAVSNLFGAQPGTTTDVDVTIADDDAQPTVTFGFVDGMFGENGGSETITVSLTNPSSADVVVNFNYNKITADRNTDYTGAVDVLTFAPGETSLTFKLTGVDDAVYEGDETFEMSITGVTGGADGMTGPITLTVVEDDAAPNLTLTLTPDNFAENAGTGAATLTASIDKIAGNNLVVNLTYSTPAGPGEAEHGVDYDGATTITITAGQTAASITLDAKDDNIYEGMEVFVVHGDLGTSTSEVTGVIDDDDPLPEVSLVSLTPAAFSENAGTGVLTVALSHANAVEAVVVNLGYTGTAANPADFTGAATATIAAGLTSATVTLTGADDGFYEGDETFTVSITGVSAGALNDTPDSLTGTVLEDEIEPLVSMTVSANTMNEAAAPQVITATLSLNYANMLEDVVVELTFTDLSATHLADYTIQNADFSAFPTVYATIGAGLTSGTFKMAAVNDTAYEADEVFKVAIANVTGGSENGTQLQNITIVSEDLAPTVTLNLPVASFSEAGGSLTVYAELSGITTADVTVPLTFATVAPTVTGIAFKGDDFQNPVPTAIIIPAGETSGSALIVSKQDTIYEGTETFTIGIGTVTGPATKVGSPTVTATILDDEVEPTVKLIVATPTFTEGTTLNGTVQLSHASVFDVVVPLVTTNSTMDPTYSAEAADINLSVTAVTIAGVAHTGGLTTGAFTITSPQETPVPVYEGDETFKLELGTITGGKADPFFTSKVITIKDAAATPTVSLLYTAAAGTPLEGGGDATVTVKLSALVEEEVVVELVYAGDTSIVTAEATPADDFAALPTLVTIPAGSTSGTVKVILDAVTDGIFEGPEGFKVSIVSVTSPLAGIGTGTPTFVVGTITDADTAPTVSLSLPATPTFSENGGTLALTATLSKVNQNQDVIVDLTYTNGTAETADYTGSTQITIPKGSLTATISLTGVDDDIYEGNEDFTVAIGAVAPAGGATAGGVAQVATIVEDDLTPQINVFTAGPTITEGGTGLVVNLAFLQSPTSPYAMSNETGGTDTVVTLGFANGTTKNADFVGGTLPFSTTVTIAAGATAGTFTITGVAAATDGLYEGDETFTVSVDGVTGGSADPALKAQTVTITDDDGIPEAAVVALTAPNDIIVEGDMGQLHITLTSGVAEKVFVYMDIAAGTADTATLGDDYTAPLGTIVTIAAGATQGTLNLMAIDDGHFDDNETFTVKIIEAKTASGTALTVGTADTQVFTIDDQDNPQIMGLTLSPASFSENGGTAVLTATMDTVSNEDVVLDLTYGGTADWDVDYTALTQLTIPAGATVGTVTLTGVDDWDVEGDEGITVTLAADTTGTIPGGAVVPLTFTASATVKDDDLNSVLTLSLVNPAVPENGGYFTVQATLDLAQPNEDIIVTFDQGVGGITTPATKGTDFFMPLNPTITIAAGTTVGTAKIAIYNDTIYEGDENFNVFVASVEGSETLAAPNVTTAIATVVATISDDELPPKVYISPLNPTFDEDGNAVITLSLVGKSAVDVVVDLTTTDIDSEGDFTISATQVTIAASGGVTSATFTVSGTGADTNYEGDEHFKIDLAVQNGTAPTPSITATITDADGEPTVQLAMGTFDNITEGVTATRNVVLSHTSDFPVVVELVATDGTALDADYDVVPTSVTIPAGTASQTFTMLAVTGDGYDPDETFTIAIGAVTGGTASTTAVTTSVVTIADADGQPTVSLGISSATFGETTGIAGVADAAVLSATLDRVTFEDIIVNLNYSTATTDATAGTDFNNPTTITIAAGSTVGTVTLSGIDDNEYEGNENFSVTMAVGTGAATVNATMSSVTATVVDDDAPPVVTLAFAKDIGGNPITMIPEDTGAFTVIAYMDRPAAVEVVIDLGITDITTEPTDYVLPTAITIAAGATTGSTTIAAVADSIFEGSGETLEIGIATLSVGTDGMTAPLTGTIVDNDPLPAVTLVGAYGFMTLDEPGGINGFYATIPADSVDEDIAIVVGLAYSPAGTDIATFGVDYSALTSVTIPAGATQSAVVEIKGLDDGLYEKPDETFTVSVGSVVGAGVTAGPGATSLEYTVLDDENPIPVVSMTIDTAAFAEDSSGAKLTLTFSTQAVTPITVPLVYTDVTTEGALDYTGPASVLFNIGVTQVSVPLTPVNDNIYEGDETFTVALGDMGGLALANPTASAVAATILDDELPPKIIISDATVTETDTANVSLTFTVSADVDTEKAYTVKWATMDSTAVAVLDYVAGSGTLTMGAGITSATVQVTVLPDDLDEQPSETMMVMLTPTLDLASMGGQITDPFGMGTIVDDDYSPVISSLGLTVDQGATGKITNAELVATDGDTLAEDLTYTVGTAPVTGTLFMDTNTNGVLDAGDMILTAGSMFTQEWIDLGWLAFEHNGSQPAAAQPEDSFTFTVNDGSNPDVAGTFAITIADVNDAPVAEFGIFTVNENLAGAAVGTVKATDLDGDTLTFSIVGGIPDAASFAIDPSSGAITTTAALDYEVQKSYTLTIQVDDGRGEANSQVTTLVVVNVADMPDYNYALGTPIADQTVKIGQNFVFVIPADTFADYDPATYFITGPAWLNFNASTETFYIMGTDTAALTPGTFTVDIGVDFTGDTTPETTDTFLINLIAKADAEDMMLREAVEKLDETAVTGLSDGESLEVMDMQEGAAVMAEAAADNELSELADMLALLDAAAAEVAVTENRIAA